MALINPFFRMVSIVLICCFMSVLGLQAYATQLNVVPPALMTIRNYTQYRTILVDLNRGTQLRYNGNPDGVQTSPDGNYWADGDIDAGILEIYMGRYLYQRHLFGSYEALATTPRMLWSQNSDGFYFLRLDDTEQRTVIVMFVDATTGEVHEHGHIQTYNIPRNMWFINDTHLMLSGLAQTDIYNTATGESFNIPVPLRYTFNTDDDDLFIAYATIDFAAEYTRLLALNIVRLSDWQHIAIDVSAFSSPPLITNETTIAWSNDRQHLAITLAANGVALIEANTGAITILDTNMRVQGGFSADDAWLLGIEDSINRVDSAIIAYNVATDERIILRSGKQPEVTRYNMLWSTDDNLAMIYSTEAFTPFADTDAVPIRITHIPSAETIYDEAVILDNTLGFLDISWDIDWFAGRNYQQFCNTVRNNC